MRADGPMWRSAVALLAAAGLAVSLASCDPDAPEASSTAQASPTVPPTQAATLQPTPTRTVEAVVTWQPTDHRPTPLPTRQVQVGSEVKTVEYDCGDYGHMPLSFRRYGGGILIWSAGSEGIWFSYDGSVWLAHNASDRIDHVLRVNSLPDELNLLGFGHYVDVSPAGDRIAYTSCAFPQGAQVGQEYGAIAREPRAPSANYDIVVGELNEDDLSRIVNNTRITKSSDLIDHYPVWSSDGEWIAVLSMERSPIPISGGPGSEFATARILDVRRVDETTVRTSIVWMPERRTDAVRSSLGALRSRASDGVALIPPVWSPEDQYISYYSVTKDDYSVTTEDDSFTYVLHTVRLDAPSADTPIRNAYMKIRSQHKIGTVTATLETIPPRPSWSPDGQRIAFVADDGTDRKLFIAQADGTDRRQVASDPGIREIAWSPDGSEILIVSDRPSLVFVSPDGASRRQVELPPTLLELSPARSEWSVIFWDGLVPDLVAWSPDGSRIAISMWGLLVTMDRDGTNPRTLNGGDLRRPAVDPAVCSLGVVVPDPEANPGLVRDCETLLKSVETLAGDFLFRWGPDRPITRWAGVRVKTDGSEGLPLRVRELSLERHGLAGSIPPMLGDLDALERLVLSNNRLTGLIPSALGKLTALRELDLSYTGLSGTLPPELANLTNLTSVDITNTRLTGCIPRDFSDIWLDGSDLERCQL